MPPPNRPHWPSDDQVREQANHREFTDDGRKLFESGRVGGLAPDADPDPPPRPAGRRSSARTRRSVTRRARPADRGR